MFSNVNLVLTYFVLYLYVSAQAPSIGAVLLVTPQLRSMNLMDYEFLNLKTSSFNLYLKTRMYFMNWKTHRYALALMHGSANFFWATNMPQSKNPRRNAWSIYTWILWDAGVSKFGGIWLHFKRSQEDWSSSSIQWIICLTFDHIVHKERKKNPAQQKVASVTILIMFWDSVRYLSSGGRGLVALISIKTR